MKTTIVCNHCRGDGWVSEPDHHASCVGDCHLCPVEVQKECSACSGAGKFEIEVDK